MDSFSGGLLTQRYQGSGNQILALAQGKRQNRAGVGVTVSIYIYISVHHGGTAARHSHLTDSLRARLKHTSSEESDGFFPGISQDSFFFFFQPDSNMTQEWLKQHLFHENSPRWALALQPSTLCQTSSHIPFHFVQDHWAHSIETNMNFLLSLCTFL